MPPGSDMRYNLNVYQVAAHGERVCIEQNSGLFPGSHANFEVYNIGKTVIYVETIYGTAIMWHGVVAGYTVEPGASKVLSNLGDTYHVTGLKVYNKGEVRALVHCGTVRGYSWYEYKEADFDIEIDINNLMKTLVVFGVGKIPYVADVLSTIIGFFWPDTEKDVWSEIEDRVEDMIDSKTLETIRGILGGDLRRYKERMTLLKIELEDNQNLNLSELYMNIAEDMNGLEQKFISSENDNSDYLKINYYLLPMYSALVTLKMMYYRLGLLKKEKLGLNSEHIYRLKNYSQRLICDTDGAKNYINKVKETRLNREYATCNPESIFDALVTVHTYVGINGLEYFSAWDSMLENPFSLKKAYTDVVTYSTYFGRPTPMQARQAVPDEIPPPLQPKLIDGKRNKLTNIEVYVWRIYREEGPPKIGGIKLTFENGDNYTMGETSAESHSVDFGGAYLTRLQVWGDGALDCLEFTFSDGRIMSYGTIENNVTMTFEAEHHHICSMFLANDAPPGLAGQAANITVSYLLTPEQ